MIHLISLCWSIFIITMMFTLFVVDKKKRKRQNKDVFKEKISVIIPYFNDGETVGTTIKSLLDSYDNTLLEIIVINDCSQDNDTKIIRDLQKKYNFRLIENNINKGKASSINENIDLAKHELILFLDADMIISRQNIQELWQRVLWKAVAASCPYVPIEKWFRAKMQKYEYRIMSYLRISHNMTSSLGIWGWCILIQKEKFMEIKWFSRYAISEDSESAMKLNKLWYNIQQVPTPIKTSVPISFKSRRKQKTRWYMWWLQSLVWYPNVFLKHPIYIIFILSFVTFSIVSLVTIIEAYLFSRLLWNQYHIIVSVFGIMTSIKELIITYLPQIIAIFFYQILYTLIYIPFFISWKDKDEKRYDIFLVFPFTIIYMPIYGIVRLVSIIKVLPRLKDKKIGRRWW